MNENILVSYTVEFNNPQQSLNNKECTIPRTAKIKHIQNSILTQTKTPKQYSIPVASRHLEQQVLKDSQIIWSLWPLNQ